MILEMEQWAAIYGEFNDGVVFLCKEIARLSLAMEQPEEALRYCGAVLIDEASACSQCSPETLSAMAVEAVQALEQLERVKEAQIVAERFELGYSSSAFTQAQGD